MGALDKAKDLAAKVEDVTEEKVDQLGGLIDKAADKIDERTGGKHSDKIHPVVDPGGASAAERQPPSSPAP